MIQTPEIKEKHEGHVVLIDAKQQQNHVEYTKTDLKQVPDRLNNWVHCRDVLQNCTHEASWLHTPRISLANASNNISLGEVL